jgi:glycosyltransferase involved in cell wall biosynthesis
LPAPEAQKKHQLPLPPMIIAVNTGPLHHYPDRERRFIYNTLKQLAINQPEHHFLLLETAPLSLLTGSAGNISVLAAGRAAKSKLLQKLWLNIKLPRLLKKNKADVFVTIDNYCSGAVKAPQCIMVLKNKKINTGFLKRAKRIMFFSKVLQKKTEAEQQIPAGKTDIIAAAAAEHFKPVNNAEKEKIKEQYSNGREFFLVNDNVSTNTEFIYLLKAFSHFKKRQQSGIQLILFAKPGAAYTAGLENYKYRDDVKCIETDEKSAAFLTASAYAVIYPFANDGAGLPLLEALQCGVPVIAAADDAIKEIAETNVLYTGDKTAKELGEKMMQIYTNETLREQLAEKAKRTAARFTLQQATALLWQSIMKTVS